MEGYQSWFSESISTNFTPTSKAELQTAVNLWVSDESSAIATYGEINTWDISNITDMSYLFQYKASFNSDISSWDVSNVTNMFAMFFYSVFNQDISSWDVSNVTNMRLMFSNAKVFNQDLSSWNVSNVSNCSAFSVSANSWDLANLPNFTNCNTE